MGRTSETLSRTVTADPMLGLSDMQLAFIENILAGMTQTLAARTAGYNNPGVEGHRLMNSVSVKNALRYLHREHEKASRMTRKKVMDGMLAALSGQFRMLPAKPSITEEMRSCWGGMTDSGVADTQVLKLKRSFDKVSAPTFERKWNAEFRQTTRNLILDATELRTLVDEGTVWIRRISETIRGRDGVFFLVNPPPKVRVMLEMLEMGKLFETALSVEEAESRMR